MHSELTGFDLKVERLRAKLLVKDVAAEMGISSSRLSRIENDDRSKLTLRMEQRYRDALAACGTSGTSASAA